MAKQDYNDYIYEINEDVKKCLIIDVNSNQSTTKPHYNRGKAKHTDQTSCISNISLYEFQAKYLKEIGKIEIVRRNIENMIENK